MNFPFVRLIIFLQACWALYRDDLQSWVYSLVALIAVTGLALAFEAQTKPVKQKTVNMFGD